MLAKTIVVIIMLATVATAGVFTKTYGDQETAVDSLSLQVTSLKQEIQTVSKQAGTINAEIVELTDRIRVARNAIVSAAGQFPGEFDANEIVGEILTLGGKSNLVVIPLSTQEWGRIDVGKESYLILAVAVKITGSMDGLVRFLQEIQDLHYPAIVIEELAVTSPIEQADGQVEADLKLTLYSGG